MTTGSTRPASPGSRALSQRLDTDKEAGRPRLVLEEQRLHPRDLATDLLEEYARERLEAGLGVLSPDDQDDYAQAIDAALFGVGTLQSAAYELVLDGESYRKHQKPGLDV